MRFPTHVYFNKFARLLCSCVIYQWSATTDTQCYGQIVANSQSSVKIGLKVLSFKYYQF